MTNVTHKSLDPTDASTDDAHMTSHTDNHTTTDGRDALWLEAQRRAAAIFGDDQTDAGTATTTTTERE